MHFDLNEDQQELRRSARRFLREQAPSSALRQWIATPEVLDARLWKRVTEDLGWTGFAIPEEFGGFGFSWLELGLVLEECGRSLLPAPLWTTTALGAGTILELGDDNARAALLPEIAAGSLIATLALTEAGGKWDTQKIDTRFRKDGDAWILSGTKTYVPWAHKADLLLTVARGEAGELGVFVVPAATPGVHVKRLATMDMTRPQGEVRYDDVRLESDARLTGATDAEAALQTVLHRAAILLSNELVGVAEASMDIAVEYAKERVQFGKPIGSFQAIKHKCANMLMMVEAARSATWYAAWEAAQGDANLAETAHVTKGYTSDIAYRITADLIQILGGIGITWEHDAHFYFKRARAAAALVGNTAQHREALYNDIIAAS